MENLTRFNQRTGIVKLKHNEEEYFVVYCNFFDDPLSFDHELGTAISKGKTADEAFSKAIIKLTKNIVELERNMELITEKINKIIRNSSSERDDEIVIGEKFMETRWNEELQMQEYYESEEVVNASIGINEKGQVFSFIA